MRRNALTWREFRTLVGGLLAADTRLTRHLSRNRSDDKPDTEGGDDE